MPQDKGPCAVCPRMIRSPGAVSVRPFNQTDGDMLFLLAVENKESQPWAHQDTIDALTRQKWIHTSCRKTSKDVRPFPNLVKKMNEIFQERGIHSSHWWTEEGLIKTQESGTLRFATQCLQYSSQISAQSRVLILNHLH